MMPILILKSKIHLQLKQQPQDTLEKEAVSCIMHYYPNYDKHRPVKKEVKKI